MEKYTLKVNDLLIEAKFYKEDIENIFIPLLKRWQKIYEDKKERIYIYFAACPGSGKSTLSLFLEYLSKKLNLEEIQYVGMDGFHYDNMYLNTHYDENNNLLKLKKGHESTFDVEYLLEKIIEGKSKDNKWPIYSRELHDPIKDKIILNKNIILLEGNYLLLDHNRWKPLLKYADDTLFLFSEDDLKEKIVNRKIQGGLNKEEASRFFDHSDLTNIEMVLHNSIKANVNLSVKEYKYKKIEV